MEAALVATGEDALRMTGFREKDATCKHRIASALPEASFSLRTSVGDGTLSQTFT